MAQQLISRVANWLANELITKRLANSHTFINAAHKLHVELEKGKKLASPTLESLQKTTLETITDLEKKSGARVFTSKPADPKTKSPFGPGGRFNPR